MGFFSGFPKRRFPAQVAERLAEGISRRDSLVFVSAWPGDFARNDDDSAGMYRMFLEFGLSFRRQSVIDSRMEAAQAVELAEEASCIFLMGGHPGQQLRLLRETGLDRAIRDAQGAVLGVSAGAINMAKRSLDTKESPVPYEGLGLADITVKPHFQPEEEPVRSALLEISAELPIFAMEDDSAIFAVGERISCLGRIYRVDRGRIQVFSQKNTG